MSTEKKAKALNGLMRHLRDSGKIEISGSKDKELLRQYGYYHSYKGYRFFKTNEDILPYSNFKQIISVVEFDNELKAMLFPVLMRIEMVTKNIVLNEIVPETKDVSVTGIYKSMMRDKPNNSKLRLKRLHLRDNLHKSLSQGFRKNNIMVKHFYDKGLEIPLWALFETITLGMFAEFLSCLDESTRKKIFDCLDIQPKYDTSYELLANVIYTINGLRNATAHNNIVFDTRFNSRLPSKNLKTWINSEIGVANISFQYFTDYIMLICCFIKALKMPKQISEKLVSQYQKSIENLHDKLPYNIYSKIVSSNTRNEILALEEYIKKC